MPTKLTRRSFLGTTATAMAAASSLNMTVPGYYAHLSALKDGENLKIPQYSL